MAENCAALVKTKPSHLLILFPEETPIKIRVPETHIFHQTTLWQRGLILIAVETANPKCIKEEVHNFVIYYDILLFVFY